jgi:hypothetical protein
MDARDHVRIARNAIASLIDTPTEQRAGSPDLLTALEALRDAVEHLAGGESRYEETHR